jgi:hypothetical protein
MIPPIHIAAPGDVPADLSPSSVSRGIGPGPGNATSLLLGHPFIVEDLSDDEGPIFVASPLKYLRFDRDSGCVVSAPVHSKPNSRKGRHNNV